VIIGVSSTKKEDSMNKSELEESLASALGALLVIKDQGNDVASMAIAINQDAIDYLDEKAGKNP
tara:strand:+ start:3677 stop:3868 length:192 start_codon:yes stop_codon:yes gene_type:complete